MSAWLLRLSHWRFKTLILACWLSWVFCLPSLAGAPGASPSARCQISWNPDLETLLLAELLAQPPRVKLTGLKAQARRELGGKHRAVDLTVALKQQGRSEAELVAYLLHFSEPSEPASAEIAGASNAMRQWWSALREFEAVTLPWLKKHGAAYKKAQTELEKALPAEDLLSMQEAWQRRRFDAYRIYFSPLLGFGEQRLGSLNLNGHSIAYALIGPVQGSDGDATFADSEKLFYLLLRDFGHAFSDSVADAISVRLGRKSQVSEIRELLARAVGARLMRQLYGPDAYEHHLQGEERQGYALVRPLAEKLADYERDATYQSLADFADRLEPVFAAGLAATPSRPSPAQRPKTGCCSDSARPLRSGQNRPGAAS